MKSSVAIAIDGPAASGKSSVGIKLANSLGFLFLDTGIMYRAVTLKALNMGLDIYDSEMVSELAEKIRIEITRPTKDDGRLNDVRVEGQDVTWQIREKRVNDSVSQVSTYPRVRSAMTEQQKIMAENVNIVMVGRDIGTIVLPCAKYKFFLSASIEERAKRRHKEEIDQGKKIEIGSIIENLRSRDETDSGRKIAPLAPAEDAILIETTNKNLDQVVEEILGYIKKLR